MFEMVDPLPGALRLKMPGFVIAWRIVDLVLCALRTLELPFIILLLVLLGDVQNSRQALFVADCRLVLWLEFGFATAISAVGLTGNIAMLCRRNWSQYFCFVSALITLVNFGIAVWQTMLLCRTGSPELLCFAIIAITLFIMLRTAFLVFDLIALFKARRFFKERDGY